MRQIAAATALFALGLVVAALAAQPGSSSALDNVLTGSVGPGFTISLTQSGSDVTSLPAGAYTVNVTDSDTAHNFHLNGPGVDQATTIVGTGSVSWAVDLQPGTYTFQCDAHATTMHGSFSVTTPTTTSASTTTTTASTSTGTTTTTPETTTQETTTTTAATTSEGTATAETTTTTAETTTTSAAAPPSVHVTVLASNRHGVRLRLRASKAGRAVVQLVRAGRTVARASMVLHGRPATLTLRAAKRLTPGRYLLRVAFAAGGRTGHASAAVRIR